MKFIKHLTYFILSLFFSLTSLFSQTARIENIQLFFDNSSNKVIITYDFKNYSAYESYDIELILQDGNNLIVKPVSVTGDVGKDITGGANKKISWSVLDDVDELSETARPIITITHIGTITIDPSMALIIDQINKSNKSKYSFKVMRDGVMLLGAGTGVSALVFKLKADDYIDQQKTAENIEEYDIAGENASRYYTMSMISGGVSIICVGFALYQYIWSDKHEQKKHALYIAPDLHNGVSIAWYHNF